MIIISIISDLALLIVCPGYLDFIRDISNYNKILVVAIIISILFHVYRLTIFSTGIYKQNQYRLVMTIVLVLALVSTIIADRTIVWKSIQQMLWVGMLYSEGMVLRDKYNVVIKFD